MNMVIAELMAAYDEKRNQWVSTYGTDEGFDAWFTGQVVGK